MSEVSNDYLRGWHDALEAALKETFNVHVDEGDYFSVVQAETLIGLGMSMEEPKSGKWIVAKGGSYMGTRNACCSNCKDFYTNDWRYMNYCPNCGAKMESEDNNDRKSVSEA